MNDTQGATKQDIVELEKRISKSIEGFVHEILNALSPEIEEIKTDVKTLKGDAWALKEDVKTLKADVQTLQSDVRELRSDVDEVKLTTGRIERKLDITIERVNDHDSQLSVLRTKTA